MNKRSGVYQLKNTITGKVYFGSSKNLYNRKNKHLSMLRRNKHRNPNVRKDCEKYGPEAFEFEILAYVPENELLEYEQVLLDLPVEKYNRCLTAGSNKGIKYSEETKSEMSRVRKGKNYWTGRTHSEEAKRKISKIKSKPVVAYRDDIEFKFASRAQAARALGLDSGSICKVVNGRLNHTGGWKFKQGE